MNAVLDTPATGTDALPVTGHLIGGKTVTDAKRLQDVWNPSTGQVGSRVAIKLGRGKNAHSGTISITFKNDEEFERITEFLNGKR